MKRRKTTPHDLTTSDKLELISYRVVGFLSLLYEVVRAIIRK